MVPSWVPRGRFLGSNSEAKMDALLGASWVRHFHKFGWIFGRQNEAKLASNWSSTKIDQKLKPKTDGLLASILDGFWWVLGAKLGGKTIENQFKKASNK